MPWWWKGQGGDRGGGREDGKGGSPRPPPGGLAAGETRAFRAVWVVIACMTFPTLAFVTGLYRPPLAFIAGAYQNYFQQQAWPVDDADAVLNGTFGVPRDKYLGGLLAADFDERSCLSRYQSSIYRKPSPHKPSRELVQRLRRYEEHHRRCAPYTALYNRTLRLLDDEAAPVAEAECRYLLWGPFAGLGNRMLSLASTFLYALLTDRVLLIDPGQDLASLFCEPFPDTTWLMPSDFPITRFEEFRRKNRQSYSNLLASKRISNDGSNARPPPSFVFVYLGGEYTTEDMYFLCEPDQAVLRTVPWLLLKSDLYFAPALFLNQEFEPVLSRLFPEKETVFHHLGRYLFHPTNKVWAMITTYYRDHLAKAGERLGIQIRIFSSWDAPFGVVSEQVINCLHKEKLLPEVPPDVHARSTAATAAEPNRTKAVLITSLYSGYFEKIKDMYGERAAVGGVAVSVHQPTHEGRQQTGKAGHDEKAWAEMYLLSLTDVLVTSARSTFGYVAHSLAGIKPWVLVGVEKGKMPEPTCFRDISMEPCLHNPPWYVCREKRNGDNAKVLPFATHCADVGGGLKLVNRTH